MVKYWVDYKRAPGQLWEPIRLNSTKHLLMPNFTNRPISGKDLVRVYKLAQKHGLIIRHKEAPN